MRFGASALIAAIFHFQLRPFQRHTAVKGIIAELKAENHPSRRKKKGDED